jgi:hypothetical protein
MKVSKIYIMQNNFLHLFYRRQGEEAVLYSAVTLSFGEGRVRLYLKFAVFRIITSFVLIIFKK